MRAVDPLGGEGLVAHWDGTSWKVMPARARPPEGRLELRAVDALSARDVWASAEATTYGEIVQDGNSTHANVLEHSVSLEHWDGTEWRRTHPPLPVDSYNLQAIAAVASDDVWAVGAQRVGYPESLPRWEPLTMHWNGKDWSVVSSPHTNPNPQDPHQFFGGLASIAAVSSNDIWAVGAYNVAMHWDGHNWTAVPTPPHGTLEQNLDVAAVSSGDVWVAGESYHTRFPSSGARVRRVLHHWDGERWVSVTQFAGLLRQGSSSVNGAITALSNGFAMTIGNGWAFQLCEAHVGATGPTPVRGATAGAPITWHFDASNTAAHGVQERALNLFDSGLRAPGTSFAHALPSAGRYMIVDPASGHRSVVTVGVGAKPTPARRTPATP